MVPPAALVLEEVSDLRAGNEERVARARATLAEALARDRAPLEPAQARRLDVADPALHRQAQERGRLAHEGEVGDRAVDDDRAALLDDLAHLGV